MNIHFSMYSKTPRSQARKRSYRLEGDDLYIIMKHGYETVIDAADFDKVSGVSWSRNDKGYAVGRKGGRLIRLHRYIFDPGPGLDVDHIDRDRLNCRRSNLRAATNAQNQRNTRGQARRAALYKGVRRMGKRWQARITVDGALIHLGTHDTQEDAAHAYDRAAVEYFGPFARLNFRKAVA